MAMKYIQFEYPIEINGRQIGTIRGGIEMDSSIAMMMMQSWIFFDYHLEMKVKEILQFIFPY